jgi:hypothetical protein
MDLEIGRVAFDFGKAGIGSPQPPTVAALPLRGRAFLFVATRLAEGDDLHQIAIELNRERVAGRHQLDAVDQRADDLPGLDLRRGLAQRFLQPLDLAPVECRQVRVDAQLGRQCRARQIHLDLCVVRLERSATSIGMVSSSSS